MAQTITVTIEIEVPDIATEKDISDWVDVEYGECNSMSLDNPCQYNSEIISAIWEYE